MNGLWKAHLPEVRRGKREMESKCLPRTGNSCVLYLTGEVALGRKVCLKILALDFSLICPWNGRAQKYHQMNQCGSKGTLESIPTQESWFQIQEDICGKERWVIRSISASCLWLTGWLKVNLYPSLSPQPPSMRNRRSNQCFLPSKVGYFCRDCARTIPLQPHCFSSLSDSFSLSHFSSWFSCFQIACSRVTQTYPGDALQVFPEFQGARSEIACY